MKELVMGRAWSRATWLALLLSLGCAEAPADAPQGRAGEPSEIGGATEIDGSRLREGRSFEVGEAEIGAPGAPTVTDDSGALDGRDVGDVTPGAHAHHDEAIAGCAGETVVAIASVRWREVQAPEADAVVPASRLTILAETLVRESLEAHLEMMVRADGEELVLDLGDVVLEPGNPQEITIAAADLGVDLAQLDYAAQIAVRVTLHDARGAFRGATSSPDLYALLDERGEAVAVTPEALRVRYLGGARPDQLGAHTEGLDIAAFGRGRAARPEDLHGDPLDDLAARGVDVAGAEGGV